MIRALKAWWLRLITDQWELTLTLPGEVRVMKDGSRIEQKIQQVYYIKKIIKIDPTRFIFIDINKHKHDIVLTSPASYHIKKTY